MKDSNTCYSDYVNNKNHHTFSKMYELHGERQSQRTTHRQTQDHEGGYSSGIHEALSFADERADECERAGQVVQVK